MKVFGDIESVNLATGARFRRVSGNGESRLEQVEPKPNLFIKDFDHALSIDITHPCSYHPSGRNHLLLNPLEREEIIARILKVLEKHNL